MDILDKHGSGIGWGQLILSWGQREASWVLSTSFFYDPSQASVMATQRNRQV